MQVWNVLHAARWKHRMQISPSGHHHTTLSGYFFATKARIDNRKKPVKQQYISSTCPHNMVKFGPLAAEIVSLVWGTPANFNGFGVLAMLLHGTLVVGVSRTLRRWTEGATYIRQGGHHVGHWPHSSLNCILLSQFLKPCSLAIFPFLFSWCLLMTLLWPPHFLLWCHSAFDAELI